MSYLDRLRRPLWDHQYRHYCHHHEYQSRRQDPPAGSLLPSASGGTEPTRSRRRRTQPAAESVPPDPGACQPPFPPRFRLFTLPPGIVTHPRLTPSPASPIRRFPDPTDPPEPTRQLCRTPARGRAEQPPPCPRQNPRSARAHPGPPPSTAPAAPPSPAGAPQTEPPAALKRGQGGVAQGRHLPQARGRAGGVAGGGT